MQQNKSQTKQSPLTEVPGTRALNTHFCFYKDKFITIAASDLAVRSLKITRSADITKQKNRMR